MPRASPVIVSWPTFLSPPRTTAGVSRVSWYAPYRRFDPERVEIEATPAEDGAFGRKVRGLKVTAAALPDYVERLARRFQEQRTENETFAQWTARASEADLS